MGHTAVLCFIIGRFNQVSGHTHYITSLFVLSLVRALKFCISSLDICSVSLCSGGPRQYSGEI